MMRRAALALALAPVLGWSAAPGRNLCVELRESGADAAGWQVSSDAARSGRDFQPQRLCVQNGESVSLALELTRPVQLWQAAPGVVLPIPVPTTHWLHAGQRLDVRPRWAGAKAPVSIEIAARASRFDPGVAAGSAQAPSRAGAELRTTLSVPLGEWVTIASTGDPAPDAGSVSTRQARAGRVLQLRVELGP
ncbi:MAG TPA: hypothetical protein PKC97_14145 [Burkholderiaceae bacterium]|nr:hypothetical protein [Burkholderiaceae bacterium]